MKSEEIFKVIETHWKNWAWKNGAKKWVVGISGGVDSSTVAALACRIFGKENVVGVSMPCDGQSDMWAVDKLFEHLGIRRVTIDIGDMFASLKQGLENNCIESTDQAKTNAPARLRMTTLYAVSQSLGTFVLNTCNISETYCGYDTRWGDQCGDYAPIKNLTKTEVVQLAQWLGLPDDLAKKTPIDGLQPLTDEEKLGITYAEIDWAIRVPAQRDNSNFIKVKKMYDKNKFKIYGVNIAGPEFPLLYDVFRIMHEGDPE